MNFWGWIGIIFFAILALYITTRLCSTAYYKSKREFLTWLKSQKTNL